MNSIPQTGSSGNACTVRRADSTPSCAASRYRLLRFAFLALLAGGAPTMAQVPATRHEPDAFLNRRRAVGDELQKQHEEQFGTAPRGMFDFGGWYNFNIFLFDDGLESSRTLRRRDWRVWGRASLGDGAHQFYARGLLSEIDFNGGDAFDGDENDIEGMNLERGVYRFDLAKYLRASHGRTIDGNLVVHAGRDLVEFGEGLTLSMPLDHVSTTGTSGDFELTTLVGKTVGSTQDFDLSRTAKRLHRTFIGGQFRYLGWERHRPFAYALWQRDRNREAVWRPLRDLDYDSFHVGIGSAGELTERFAYATELVFETGHSSSQRTFDRDNHIRAWAVDAELTYLFTGVRRGRLSVEYLFASGDSGRTISPTNTASGVQHDRRDTGFVGFGFRETGLSFAPRYSNLHMLRAGASLYPWAEDRNLRHLELGTDWYLYYKNHHDGAVSDPTADLSSGYLGWETDYFANWRVTADLAYTARVGVFFPGRAFSDRTTRTFALVGVVWSF